MGGSRGKLQVSRVEKYGKSRMSWRLVGDVSMSLFRLGFPLSSVQGRMFQLGKVPR